MGALRSDYEFEYEFQYKHDFRISVQTSHVLDHDSLLWESIISLAKKNSSWVLKNSNLQNDRAA